MPKPVDEMTVDELQRELVQIRKQIAAGKVGTPNVYVRQSDLERALSAKLTHARYEIEFDPAKTDSETIRKAIKLLYGVQVVMKVV